MEFKLNFLNLLKLLLFVVCLLVGTRLCPMIDYLKNGSDGPSCGSHLLYAFSPAFFSPKIIFTIKLNHIFIHFFQCLLGECVTILDPRQHLANVI